MSPLPVRWWITSRGTQRCTLSQVLLWRRTSLLGCFVCIPVMTNVAMLNWMFDVPVKLYSTHLLLFGIALLAPDLPRLCAFFLGNRRCRRPTCTSPVGVGCASC